MNCIWQPFWLIFPVQFNLDWNESLRPGFTAVIPLFGMVMYLFSIWSASVFPQTIFSKFLQSCVVPKLNSHENMALELKLAKTVPGGSFVNFVPGASKRENCLINFWHGQNRRRKKINCERFKPWTSDISIFFSLKWVCLQRPHWNLREKWKKNAHRKRWGWGLGKGIKPLFFFTYPPLPSFKTLFLIRRFLWILPASLRSLH